MFNKINSKRLIALFCTLCLVFTACFAGGMSVSADTTLTDVTTADIGITDYWAGAGQTATTSYAKSRADGWLDTRFTFFMKTNVSAASTSVVTHMYFGAPTAAAGGLYFQITHSATDGVLSNSFINTTIFGETGNAARLNNFTDKGLDCFRSKDKYLKYTFETKKVALDEDGVVNDVEIQFYINDVDVIRQTYKDNADNFGKYFGVYNSGAAAAGDDRNVFFNSCYPIATAYEDCTVWSLKAVDLGESFSGAKNVGTSANLLNTVLKVKADTPATGSVSLGFANAANVASPWANEPALVFDFDNEVLYTSTGVNVNASRNKLAYYPSDFGLTTFKSQTKLPVAVYVRHRVTGAQVHIEVTPEVNGVKGVPTYFSVPSEWLAQGIYTDGSAVGTTTFYDDTPVVLEKLNVANYDHKFTFNTLAAATGFAGFAENGTASTGSGTAGRLSNDDVTVGAADYDKVLLTGYVKFDAEADEIRALINDNSTMGYNEGMQIVPDSTGSRLFVQPRAGAFLSFTGVTVNASDYGYETFFNKELKLQISLDKVADADTLQVGIWINGVLANNAYIEITGTDNLAKLGSYVKAKGIDYVSAHYFTDYEVFGRIVEVEAGAVSYEVAGTVKNAVTGADVTAPITTRGDFIVEDAAGAKDAIILWTAYDVSPDGDVNVKDLVALKKYEAEIELDTQAGTIAASKLDGAASLLAISEYIVEKITVLP